MHIKHSLWAPGNYDLEDGVLDEIYDTVVQVNGMVDPRDGAAVLLRHLPGFIEAGKELFTEDIMLTAQEAYLTSISDPNLHTAIMSGHGVIVDGSYDEFETIMFDDSHVELALRIAHPLIRQWGHDDGIQSDTSIVIPINAIRMVGY